MLTIKKIRTIIALSLAFMSTTIVSTKSTPMTFGKGCVTAAGSILGYLAGHYGTAYQIKRSHDNTLNPMGSEKIDKVAPIMGGLAFALIGGILAYQLWDELHATKKMNTSSTQDESESELSESNDSCKVTKNKENAVKVSDIIGLDSVMSDIKDVIDQIKNPQHYKKFGVTLPKGILLEGPPGTGKTMIAKALAHEMDCEFLYASASSFENQYIGVGARNVRNLFNKAKKSKFTIIFIDEIDSIGSRDNIEGQYRAQTINELLTQMDGFTAAHNILVIAATNHREQLDEALIRPGRFDRLIKVPLPDYAGRYALGQHLQKTKPHINISDTWLKKMATETNGLGAGDIKNIFNMAALEAAKEKASYVDEKYLQEALRKVLSERKKAKF